MANILSLSQHLKTLKETPEAYHPSACIYCQETEINYHGVYYRQSDRLNPSQDTLNPIRIPRFRCVSCKRTFATLPECIPPRRWYLWIAQEEVLNSGLSGASAHNVKPIKVQSRSTIKRWYRWLENAFPRYWVILCSAVSEQGYYSKCADFWRHWFKSRR